MSQHPIILGGPLEERFIQTLTGAGGSAIGLVNRPLASLLAALCALLWTVTFLTTRTKLTDDAEEIVQPDSSREW